MSDDDEAANLYRAADVLNNQKGGKYRAGRKRKQPAKKPLPEGWRPAQGNKGRGAPGFCPTAAERTLVAILSSGFLDQPDICRVIGAQRGQKPIGISTLRKCLAREISGGKAFIRTTAVRGFYKALKARRFEGSETIGNAAFQTLVDRYRGRPLAEYALAPQEIEIELS